MEVKVLRRMVKRCEDDQKVGVVVTDHDSKMGKVIRESRQNVKHETTQIKPKGRSTAIVKNFQRRRDSFCPGSRSPLGTDLIMSYINLSPITRRLKCVRTCSITIAATTPNVTIQHIRAINGRTGTCLKLKRVCDGI
jgi:hypothetical protein